MKQFCSIFGAVQREFFVLSCCNIAPLSGTFVERAMQISSKL